MMPSIEIACKIAEALEVSLDYLEGNTDLLLEKTILKRITDIQRLALNDKNTVFALLDAFLRDTKTKQAYSE